MPLSPHANKNPLGRRIPRKQNHATDYVECLCHDLHLLCRSIDVVVVRQVLNQPRTACDFLFVSAVRGRHRSFNAQSASDFALPSGSGGNPFCSRMACPSPTCFQKSRSNVRSSKKKRPLPKRKNVSTRQPLHCGRSSLKCSISESNDRAWRRFSHRSNGCAVLAGDGDGVPPCASPSPS